MRGRRQHSCAVVPLPLLLLALHKALEAKIISKKILPTGKMGNEGLTMGSLVYRMCSVTKNKQKWDRLLTAHTSKHCHLWTHFLC